MSRLHSTQPDSLGMPVANTGGFADLYQFDVIDMIKRKFWLIVFFTLMGIALGLLFFFKAPKTYRSTAKIFVDEMSTPGMTSADGEGFRRQNSVEKYIEILRSSRILQPAIQKGGFDRMVTFEEIESPLRYLRDGKALIAKSADIKASSGVIRISFDGPSPTEAQQILTSVVSAFGDHIESTAKNVGGDAAKMIEQVQNEMLSRLTEVETQIQQLMANPELMTVNGQVISPFQLGQSRTHEELHELRRERMKLMARIDNIKQARNSGKSLDALMISIMQDFNEGSLGAYVTTHNQFVELKMQEQQLLNQYGSQHPDLLGVRRQIAMVDQLRMQELSTLRGGDGSRSGVPSQGEMVDIFIEHMKNQVQMLLAEEQSMQSSIAEEQVKSSSTSADVEKLMALQRERERLERGYYTVIDRLGEINVLKDFSWRKMSVLNPASNAEQVAPSLPLCLGGGLFLGCLFGFLFAGLKEVAEKTFRSSEAITSVLGARVIGHVNLFQKGRPKKDSPFAEVAPEVITLHNPSDPSSESYRSIRTAIYFHAQETEAKVIQITSPTPGDGKSTTISNLAASMAQSGRKVLVIDADFRKPVQHRQFGVSNDYGMTSVIYGEMDPHEAVQVVQPEYLSVVTCGPIPPNPAELITSARFQAIIEEYREHYDYILIDTPPLLAVTDPSVVCRYVDLVYLVMRIRNGVRTNSLRAKEIIDSMGVELGGVIINGLRRRDHKNYEYGSYGGYGYGGRYGTYGSYGKNYGAPQAIGKAGAGRPMIAGPSGNGNGSGSSLSDDLGSRRN